MATRATAIVVSSDSADADGLATIGRGVAVRASGVEGAGNGLFATRAFRRNELITSYEGERIDRAEALRRRARGDAHYIVTLSAQHAFMDGLRDPVRGMGGGSFVNHHKSAGMRNAKFHVQTNRMTGLESMLIKATRDIDAGEEIFVNYGRGYFRVNDLEMR